MGWNSWDAYGTTVTESEFKANADHMASVIPAVNRFPSSASGHGFKPLADYVQDLGLKFGIRIMRGISTCPWNSDMYAIDMSRPDAAAYYNSIVKLYASWGVDYIKADDIARPAHREEIAAIHHAIVATGRPIVVSLSPGLAMIQDAAFLSEMRVCGGFPMTSGITGRRCGSTSF